MILIFAQLLLLLLTAWGWGYWVWKVSGASREPGWQRHGWFFFGIGGYAACVLFLHALVYLDLPLGRTSWAAQAVALGGVLACARGWRRESGRHAPWRRRPGRETLASALLFALVFAGQGSALLHAGPGDYYGNAHTDQVNYVLLAQFLVEKPFSTTWADVGLQPWLVKPLQLNSYRLGQSVANGYLAVGSWTDAKLAYGTLSVFVVCLGALAVFVLGRRLGLPRWLAFLTGGWWGVLPAVTKVHLDGFLSQSCVLFVFPAMAALCLTRRDKPAGHAGLMALLLAYLLCTYTEVYVLGVALLGSLLLFQGRPPGRPLAVRVAHGAAIVAASMLLTGGYVKFFFAYVVRQYASADSPLTLADLVPQSGTWVGWKQIFFGTEPFANAAGERLSLLVGIALVLVAAGAFQGANLGKRRFLLAMIAPSLGVLGVLLSAPVLPKYPFSKLLDTFTPFWLVLMALGAVHLGALVFRRPGRVRRLPAWGMVALFAVLGLRGSLFQWRRLYDHRADNDTLAVVTSPNARRCYETAAANRGATYLIEEPHPILGAWLAYAARHSDVYVDVEQISDSPLPPSEYRFRHIPPLSGNLTMLDSRGPKRLDQYRGDPEVVVHNPQGAEGVEANHWYWVGKEATLDIISYGEPGEAAPRYFLEFKAMAGPANPDPARGLTLTGPEGSQQAEFREQGTVRFPIALHPGKNSFTLKVAYPAEQTFTIPSDPRNLMVRIERLVVTAAPGR